MEHSFGIYNASTLDSVCAIKADIATADNSYNCISSDYVTVGSQINQLSELVEKLTKTPEVHPDTTTKLEVKNGKIYVKHYKDGFFKTERYLISDITDVKVHNKTVLVTFKDGTKTVAVLDDEDKFSLEQGISICITKKLLGENGSAIYNKLIKRALKVKKQNEQDVAKKEKEKAEIEQRKALVLKRHQKKQAKKREARIEEMAEAYVRAVERLNFHCDLDK